MVNCISAQQAIQEKSGDFNSIFVGNKSVAMQPNQQFFELLTEKFSRSVNNQSQSYNINLPGYGKVEVKRAGTMLVIEKDGKQYVVIGVDENNYTKHAATGKQPYSTWFSGGLEAKDGGVYEGLMRETFEESAGTIYISKAEFDHAISNKRFMYDPIHKTLAIVKYDNSGNFDVNKLNARLAQVKSDTNIGRSFKEMKEFSLVHPGELRHMNNVIGINKDNNGGMIEKNPHNHIYTVKSSNGTARILKEYADSFYRGNGVQALYNTIGNFPSF